MLHEDDTALILIDVQGKLAKAMNESEQFLKNINKLVEGANILNIPIIWMEQYPKGLGPSVESIQTLLAGEIPIEKMVFSAYGSEHFWEKKKQLNKQNFLIAGIEAHVCVYQTVCELLEEDYHVEVVEDCIASRSANDKQIAIRKMQAIGAYPSSLEMALFELMKTAEHPKFKDISKLIK